MRGSLRCGAPERHPLKRTVSPLTASPSPSCLCVCWEAVHSQVIQEQLLHSCGPFRAICFSAFSTFYFPAPVSSVRAEGRGRMLALYLGKCGEMSYLPYGWNNWLTWYFKNNLVYGFLVVLGLAIWASVALLVAVCRLPIVVVSLAAERRL